MSGDSYSKKRKPSLFNHERNPATFQLEILKLNCSTPSLFGGNMKSALLYFVVVAFIKGAFAFFAFVAAKKIYW